MIAEAAGPAVAHIASQACENSRESVLNGNTIESSIPSDKQTEALDLVRDMCGEHKEAMEWLYTTFNIAMTWDHIVDDDDIDAVMADDVFTKIVTEWPFNKFYNSHSIILATVWSNCISAWKSTNRMESPKIKSYDVFCETTGAVCFLIHGNVGVEKWMPEFRKLMYEICKEDDFKDGGKL